MMKEPVSACKSGVIAHIEMFTIDEEELRQFVIYTYYDSEGEPLYVGASKDFYNAHYSNAQRLSYFKDISFVGFVLLEDETNMKESKKYYVRARQPQHNRRNYNELPYLLGLDVHSDDFVVSREDMEQRWREFNGEDEKAAWDFAIGLAGIDGTDVSPELLELVAANASDEEIHRWIHEHYIEGQRIYTHEEVMQLLEEDDGGE